MFLPLKAFRTTIHIHPRILQQQGGAPGIKPPTFWLVDYPVAPLEPHFYMKGVCYYKSQYLGGKCLLTSWWGDMALTPTDQGGWRTPNLVLTKVSFI